MKEILYIYKELGCTLIVYIDKDGHSRDLAITDFVYINNTKTGIALDIKNIIIKDTWYKYGNPYILSTFNSFLRKNKTWISK